MKPFVHDLWAPLSHIEAMTEGERPRGFAQWLDDEDSRRLMAYKICEAYRDNVRRFFLNRSLWVSAVEIDELSWELRNSDAVPAASKMREYGNGRLIIDTARSIVLGDDQTVVFPDLADADPEDTSLDQTRAAADWLAQWAEDEHLASALMVGEEHAVTTGDSVYVLSWSNSRKRPRLRTYTPGFYFPDTLAADQLPGWEDDYPPVKHIAWEYTDQAGVKWLRRSTWRMVKLDQPRPSRWGPGKMMEWTCLASVAEWPLDRIEPGDTVYNLNPERKKGRFLTVPGNDAVGEIDLQIDFIPIIHIPNDEPGQYHFGRSLLLSISHILDDLAGADTDLALTSASMPSGTVVTTGDSSGDLASGPGMVWHQQAGASAAMLDTSRVLTAGLAFDKHLFERLAVNSRLTMALLGQISPKDVPSGVALSLGFAPAKQLLREMRRVRTIKHALLLKFVLRMAQQYGVLKPGLTPTALIELGAALPSDRAAVIDDISTLLPLKAISTETAVRMLMGVGVPIDDVEDEIARIHAEDTERAAQLVDATGDTEAARERLGLAVQAPTTLPTVPNNDQGLSNAQPSPVA